ncbi:FG-GAP repeat domain-containing protein [Desulfohalovibrio reitneri]|uniref:FG-GAP repeat domain-containing protein n=1 Tax=Desulfohalovibrio reitneri TaxID=1307759 RepID=UPI0004A70883|nr:VCBS repeat-containing protein [Desulfohalovibrio reitneri]
MKRIVQLAALLLVFVAASPALAQQGKTFSVLPFEINGPEKYAYLSKGIQNMLSSRLSWQDRLRSIPPEEVAENPQGKAEALRDIKSLGVDYLVWGSANIMGENVSLDMMVQDRDGRQWPKSDSVPLADLIPRMEEMARQVNAEVFAKPSARVAEKKNAEGETQGARVLNPELVQNKTQGGAVQEGEEFTLNPAFRYQNVPQGQGKWRSQGLPFASVNMQVRDLDGDGRTEVVVVNEEQLIVFRREAGKLRRLAAADLPKRFTLFRMSLLDTDRDGQVEIFASGYTGGIYMVNQFSEGKALTLIYTFDQGSLTMQNDGVELFMAAQKLPPSYTYVLVGQRMGADALFSEPVHEVMRRDGEYVLGPRINLPKNASPFNFAFLPADGNINKILGDEDHLSVYNNQNEQLAKTGEEYANSIIAFDMPRRVGGLGVAHGGSGMEEITMVIPTRLVLHSVNQQGRRELLVARNISTAASFFQRYRNFPYGELHSLYWDGVGLSVDWKTRRQNGAVVDYDLADIDNDGDEELCLAVNTHTGAAGIGSQRTVVLAFDLNTGNFASGSGN